MTTATAIFCLLSLVGTRYEPLRAGDGPMAGQGEVRAQALGKTLRCAVCQGTSIADSPAPMAQAMLDRVRELIKEGKSDAEIRDYFVARYGEFILLEPEAQGFNWLVWLLPVAFLAGGTMVLSAMVRRGKRESPKDAEAATDDPYLAEVRKEIES